MRAACFAASNLTLALRSCPAFWAIAQSSSLFPASSLKSDVSPGRNSESQQGGPEKQHYRFSGEARSENSGLWGLMRDGLSFFYWMGDMSKNSDRPMHRLFAAPKTPANARPFLHTTNHYGDCAIRRAFPAWLPAKSYLGFTRRNRKDDPRGYERIQAS